ncbi:hypothetical protein [Caballeronia sordidicola]|uniref:Uncharacterized protein n=1 Tax=Caballeronia sordidicola TaxID=196367 RepID=A0A2C9XUN2_CABSO|nr:hypothetical protein [Caballeronia sordidicola]OTP65544.1 hypothetical protein PAMC26510_38020 [Caballeronia sordidicola]
MSATACRGDDDARAESGHTHVGSGPYVQPSIAAPRGLPVCVPDYPWRAIPARERRRQRATFQIDAPAHAASKRD